MSSKYDHVDLTKNPIWVKRTGNFFDSLDLNADGKLCIEEIIKWAQNMEKACKATPQKMKAMREGLQEFWGEAGLVPGAELDREQFLKGVHNLAKAELKRKSQGKPTLHEKMNNAFFDVADMNNDEHVTLEELKTIMKACNKDPNSAESWFAAADINKNGLIEREELCKSEFDFWFHPEVQSTQGLFGGAYE